MNQNTNSIFAKNDVIIEHSDGATIYKSKINPDVCILTCYPIFEGIELVYYDIHTNTCDIELTRGREILEVNHCQEGRVEFEYKNGEYLYLSSGDLSIQKHGKDICNSYFPIGHYHGISVMIDMTQAPRCLSCVLDDVFVTPTELVSKFCSNNKTYTVMRENKSIEHIFSELYSVPENIRKGYLKVKVLELLLFLSGLEISFDEERRYFSRSQVTAAKQAKEYLINHLDEQVTIPQLADVLDISQTTLKMCFKGVYGDTIHTFVNNYKMQTAAALLKDTDRSVLDIAGSVGYTNGSKFAGAFKKIMNVTPNEFRKLYV